VGIKDSFLLKSEKNRDVEGANPLCFRWGRRFFLKMWIFLPSYTCSFPGLDGNKSRRLNRSTTEMTKESMPKIMENSPVLKIFNKTKLLAGINFFMS